MSTNRRDDLARNEVWSWKGAGSRTENRKTLSKKITEDKRKRKILGQAASPPHRTPPKLPSSRLPPAPQPPPPTSRAVPDSRSERKWPRRIISADKSGGPRGRIRGRRGKSALPPRLIGSNPRSRESPAEQPLMRRSWRRRCSRTSKASGRSRLS